jgi:hypothetical protein
MEKAQKYAEGVINDPVVEFAWYVKIRSRDRDRCSQSILSVLN